MSKICKYCWEPIEDGAEECKNCGKKVSEMLEQNRLTQKRLNLKDKKEDTAEKTEESDAAKKTAQYKKLEYMENTYNSDKETVKLSPLVIITAVIIILGVIGYGVYYNYFKNNNDKSLNQMLNILALQDSFKDQDTQGFDPNAKFRYSDNPYFKDRDKNPGNQDLFDNRGNEPDFGGW